MPEKSYRIQFTAATPTPESYWRSIVMFGANTASYKFALGKALLDVVKLDQEFVPLETIALPYAKAIAEHVGRSPKQGSFDKSTFVDFCSQFYRNEIDEQQLVNQTLKIGFKDVLGAFHKVNGQDIADPFFQVEKRGSTRGLSITAPLIQLASSIQSENLPMEVEARWNLVETSWSQKISRNLLSVEYDDGLEQFVVDDGLRRVEVTSARNALNAYQKGFCFYCYDDISIVARSPKLAQVDHVFPFRYHKELAIPFINGVWNLVLACRRCNGASGKWHHLPSRDYLQRLFDRNEYLIASKHPLHEYIVQQMGATQLDRARLLRTTFEAFTREIGAFEWSTKPVRDAAF